LRFRVFRSDGSSKTLQKCFAKNRVEKLLPNKSIFVDFFIAFFGRFSVRRVQKHHKKTDIGGEKI
jgi:hypothetical protein